MSAPFISYAQHGEDVVLYRALREVTEGFYVDVGAADPTIDSVTRALYGRGWHGVDIEAYSVLAQRLRNARPHDEVVECAAGAVEGHITFHQVRDSGLSTTDEAEAAAAAERGFTVTTTTVAVRPLDHILAETVPAGQEIHFLKIDVEGAEEPTLAGIDLRRWRPWIVLVEATRPNTVERTADRWQHHLTAAGYVPAMFDGLNQWFRSPDHPELDEALSYPACPLDDYRRYVPGGEVQHALAAAHLATLEARDALRDAERSKRKLRANLVRAQRKLSETRRKLEGARSRRGTRRTPLARLRRFRRRGVQAPLRVDPTTAPAPDASARRKRQGPGPIPQDVVLSRMRAVLVADGAGDLPRDMAALREWMEVALAGPERNLWIWVMHLAWTGSLADDIDLEDLIATLDLSGLEALEAKLNQAGASVPDGAWSRTAAFDVTSHAVVDVTHTATHDVHTGIQRVVRETVPRWQRRHPLELVVLDPVCHTWRKCTEPERARVLSWPTPFSGGAQAEPAPTRIVVPWRTRVVVPELAAAIRRADLLRGMAVYSGSRISLIAYDLTPFTRSESAADQLPSGFARYLSVLKYADRVSAISRTVAQEYAAFGEMLVGQGLSAPHVQAQTLPAVAHALDEVSLQRHASTVLGVARLPLVLSVSSIEPRKNHLRTLEAAERLWQEGLVFQLTFVAGAGWKRAVFDETVHTLQRRGRPVRVLSGLDDEMLWAHYHFARCTVFVSLLEGFGLPAAESLSAGTPVVLTEYGSMAEIGEDGGALMVDPRNVDAIADALRRLLVDDVLHAELVEAAGRRSDTTWDSYAELTWDWLVEGVPDGASKPPASSVTS